MVPPSSARKQNVELSHHQKLNILVNSAAGRPINELASEYQVDRSSMSRIAGLCLIAEHM